MLLRVRHGFFLSPLRVFLLLLTSLALSAGHAVVSTSQTGSVTSSPSPTQLPTPLGIALLDGTNATQASAALDSGVALPGGSSSFAASLRITETDASCGPGKYSLTELVLLASLVGGGSTAHAAVQVGGWDERICAEQYSHTTTTTPTSICSSVLPTRLAAPPGRSSRRTSFCRRRSPPLQALSSCPSRPWSWTLARPLHTPSR